MGRVLVGWRGGAGTPADFGWGYPDAGWGDTAPATAAQVIRSYIYQLRLVLGRDGTGRIRSASGGYALEPGPQLDLSRFADQAARARQARLDGDPATAAENFAEGLGLWAGAALAGIPGPYAAAQRTRLNELRLAVQEEHLACAVELGRYDQAAAELSALVAGHPLRERLRELQMLALYGAGRQDEALEAFGQASRQLRDELGLDPGPALRTMHQRILSTDPALLCPAPASASPPGATAAPPAADPPPVPAQLPADIAHFTGRDTQLGALTALAADAGRAVVITAIGGTAGVGKTALAIRWAHRHAALFPTGRPSSAIASHSISTSRSGTATNRPSPSPASATRTTPPATTTPPAPPGNRPRPSSRSCGTPTPNRSARNSRP